MDAQVPVYDILNNNNIYHPDTTFATSYAYYEQMPLYYTVYCAVFTLNIDVQYNCDLRVRNSQNIVVKHYKHGTMYSLAALIVIDDNYLPS